MNEWSSFKPTCFSGRISSDLFYLFSLSLSRSFLFLSHSFYETEENGTEWFYSETGDQLLRLQAVSIIQFTNGKTNRFSRGKQTKIALYGSLILLILIFLYRSMRTLRFLQKKIITFFFIFKYFTWNYYFFFFIFFCIAIFQTQKSLT